MKHLYLLISLLFFNILNAGSQSFVEQSKLVDPHRTSYDEFGSSVLLDDSLAFVGSPRNEYDANNENEISYAGALEIFELKADGSWVFKQKLCAADRSEDAFFGNSIALSGDYLAVGALYEAYDDQGLNYIEGAGSIYLFEKKANGQWEQIQKLVPEERGYEDEFGESIGFQDGILVAGASYDDEDANGENLAYEAGSVYVFKQAESGLLEQIQKLTSPIRYSGDYFGVDVALSLPWLVVGAEYESEDENEANPVTWAGAAYVFKWDDQSETFAFEEKLVASDRQGQDYFGSAVAICDTNILIGVRDHDYDLDLQNELSGAGAAYVYSYNETAGWKQQEKLVAPTRGANFDFGFSVAIDSSYFLVGAPQQTLNNELSESFSLAGMAYLYQKAEDGSWELAQSIAASDFKEQAKMGSALDLHGNRLLVGAERESTDENNENPLSGAGAAYLFLQCTPTYSSIDTTGCDLYESPAGKTYTLPGTYYDTLVNAGGCDSIITIYLDFTEIDTIVVQNGATLVANEQRADYYQWIDCDTEALIEGANSDQYQALSDGTYALIMYLGACVDTSACFTVVLSHVDAESLNDYLIPYPNPCTESFQIPVRSPARLSLFSATGKKVLEQQQYTGQSIGVEKLPAGLYFVKVNCSSGIISRKLIVR